MNLDPFTHYADDKLWNALEQTGLKVFVQSLEEGLEYMCSEGGENLRSVCGIDFISLKTDSSCLYCLLKELTGKMIGQHS